MLWKNPVQTLHNAQSVHEALDAIHADGISLSLRELLQYESKIRLMDLSPRYALQSKLAGSYVSNIKGRGMEFDEVRHYQAGDDIRTIDWRVTARTGKTHTKLFREEKERPVFLLTDLTRTMQFGSQFLFKSVQAAHLASLIAWAAVKRGDRLGGLVISDHQHREIKPKGQRKAVLHYLNSLIQLQNSALTDAPDSPPGTFSDACARLRHLARPGALIFIISDFTHLDEKAKKHLSHLSRHCEVIAYEVTDPLEHDLPEVSVTQQVSMTDGLNTEVITIGDGTTNQKYHSQSESVFGSRRDALMRARCQVRPITASQKLEQQLGVVT